MDPNANLSEQLALSIKILYGEDTQGDSERLAELVIDLHEWLLKGGFKPDLWS